MEVKITGLESVLSELQRTRLQIANHRAAGLTENYPEIIIRESAALDSPELIRMALKRELKHQRQVLSDIRKNSSELTK